MKSSSTRLKIFVLLLLVIFECQILFARIKSYDHGFSFLYKSNNKLDIKRLATGTEIASNNKVYITGISRDNAQFLPAVIESIELSLIHI